MKKIYLMTIFAASLLSCTASTEDDTLPTAPNTPTTPSTPSSPDNGSHGESPYASLISKTTAYPSS